MGHAFAFGNTEEKLHLKILGCKARGLPTDPPLNHTTGEGRVLAHKGDYTDALVNKNNAVVALIAETFGGLGWQLVRTLKFIARTASDVARGRDSTDYGRARRGPGHLAFHARRIACRAVYGDATHISGGVNRVKHLAAACHRAVGVAAACAPLARA